MEFVQPIRDLEKLKDMENCLKEIDIKYYVMFEIGLYSGLRISDILKLRIRDVRNKNVIKVKEQKTGKEKLFSINPKTEKLLSEYCYGKKDFEYLIPSKKTKGKPIDRTYAWRVIKRASKEVGIENLGTHSMRKTFGYHYYKQTQDIAMLQILFNHSSPHITLRYIGIEQDNVLDAMRKFDFRP